MLFTEPTFGLAYLPIVLGIYFAVPATAKNYVLTLASLVFYAAGEPAFVPWLVGSTLVSYAIAIAFDRWRGSRRGTALLAFGIAIDLALLVVFKYAGFFTGGRIAFALPLGISFFTFHKISYMVDVARGVAEVRRNPVDLFLYIALFPQLIAGPIVRYHEIDRELARRDHRLDDFAAGIRRFVVGFGSAMSFVCAPVGLGPSAGTEHTVAHYLDRPVELALVAGVLAALPILPAIRTRVAAPPTIEFAARCVAVPALAVVRLCAAMQMAANSYDPFIYFRF